MNAVKGLGTAVLCFILFISLALFSMAFWVNTTVLNQDFISRQVDKIDISEMAREIVDEWVDIDLPAEVAIAEDVIFDLVYDVVDQYEGWIKTQVDEVTDGFYTYLKGDSEVLDVSIALGEIKYTLKDKLWVVFNEKADTVLPDIIGSDLTRFIGDNLVEYVRDIPQGLLPDGFADLSDAQLESFLNDHIEMVNEQIDSLDTTTIISGLTEEIVRPFFDEFIDEFIDEIPDEYVIDEELLGPEGMDVLEAAQKGLSYFNAGFYALIGFILLLMAGVFLIYRDVKNTSLALGITLGFYGFLQVAGSIIARSFNPFNYAGNEVPAMLEDVALSIYSDLLAPMLWFNIAVLVVGVALIVVSFVVKAKRAED